VSAPLSIVDLVARVGAENIGVQTPLAEGTFIACNKRKGYSELSFATYPELAEELFRDGRASKTLLVLVMDTEAVERAKAAHASEVSK
jgi:hypothetical protein